MRAARSPGVQQTAGITQLPGYGVAGRLRCLSICCRVLQVEQCGLKLAHQFPWAASAYVAVGLALRRRELSYPDMPSSAPKRKQIMKVGMGSTLLESPANSCLSFYRAALG